METPHKYLSLASYDSNAIVKDMEEEEEEKEFIPKPKKTVLNRMNSINNKPELTSEECELLSSQMYILSDKTVQIEILSSVLSIYPNLNEAFSMVSGNEGKATYLLTMVKKGYDMIRESKYNSLHNTLSRHTRYGISEQCMITTLNKILEILIKTLCENELVVSSEKDLIIAAWNKATDILIDIIPHAYTTKKKLKKHRNFIQRSMSPDDIKCVVTIWNKLIAENKDTLSEFLASKIGKHSEISIIFQRHSIDIKKQASVIITMLDATINELSNTDELIPFLKRIGYKHTLMNIKPQLLASMKKMILDSVKTILSFNYTDDIKQAWNRVLAFIIGIMIRKTEREESIYSTTASSSYASGFASYDIDSKLTPEIIKNCQLSWQRIETVIDRAVKIFYNNLCNSKDEIKLLFSSTNMVQQSQRLCKAIGSTVALLDETEILIPILIELGKRHVFYGVQPEHFKYLKKCWFNMLKQALSLSWNDKINESWNATWAFITYYMKTSLEDALLLYIPPDPVSVKFKVLINHIDRVKVSDLSFYADIWFAAYTGNNASQSYAFGDDVNGVNNIPKNKSLPFGGIRCLNAMQISDRYRSLREPYIRYFEDNQSWYLRGHLVGTFSQTFDLRAYPFDKHDIEIVFALERDDSISSFDTEHISVRMMPFKLDAMAGCNYNVYEPTIELLEHSATKGGSRSGKKYTHCRIVIPISRIYTHSIYNIMLPLTVIELCAFSIYFTDLFPITARLILSMTLLLTLVAFRRSITTSLPPTPYLTVIDHTFNSACLLSFLHIVGLCVINQFQHLPMETTKVINLEFAFFALFVFVVVHIVLIWKAKHYIDLYPTHTVQDMLDNHDAMGMIARKIERQNTLSRSSVFPR